jgi:hypothetical protein
MTYADKIPGYTFGTRTVTRSPVSLEELTRLIQTVSLTDEDFANLRRAGEVLTDHLDAVVDSWREAVAATPHLAQYYASSSGVPDDNYKRRVRERFKRWILDVCGRPYDRAWLDYQEEIGRRHSVLAKNGTDGALAVANIPLRYVVAFTAVINDRIRPFLAAGGADATAAEAMHSAWCKAVQLHVALWSRPYVSDVVW